MVSARCARDETSAAPGGARSPAGPADRGRLARVLSSLGAWRYLLAVAAWVAALGARSAIDAVLGNNPFFTPFYPAVALAAWFGGAGPGMLVVALSVASGAPLWMRGGSAPGGWEDWLYVTAAGCTMTLIVLVLEWLHRERRRAEESSRRARQHGAALAEAAHRREEFVAMLGHELRNPLHAMLGAVELLPQAGTTEERVRLQGVLERHGARLRRLLDGLLDASSVARGRPQLRVERVDLREVVERAVAAADVEGRGHRLAVACPDGPLFVDADPDRLEEALFNLLDNAARHNPAGGHVALEIVPRPGRVVVEVRDDGAGMGPLRQHAFEPFTQGGSIGRGTGGGLGMGLFLVRWVVEAHGGRVDLESGLGAGGTTVTLELPLAAEPAPEGAEEKGAAPARGLRILLVDDDPDSAWSLARLLERDGHVVATADGGETALERFTSFWPDAVVSDIGLPRMDGFELAREIVRRSWPEPPLLIALTGFGDAESRRRVREAGYRQHMLKPVEIDALRRALAEAPGRSGADGSGRVSSQPPGGLQ